MREGALVVNRIIIDTDIGGDIDDLLAITMALNSPELQIEGITTVGMRSDLRAKIASALLHLYHLDHIPVAAGAQTPLSGECEREEYPNQYGEELADFPVVSEVDGADLMIRLVNKAPGEITIVAIGAMTNLALAIERSPEFIRNVKEIILMGGEYSAHYREYNIVSDPEAADILFRSGIPLTAAGLEVCLDLTYDTDQAVETFLSHGTEQMSFLARLVKRWQSVGVNRPIIMFDAIPFALLIDRSLAVAELRSVQVETKGEHTRGMTYSMKPHFGESHVSQPNVHVCLSIDDVRIMDMFADRVLRT